MQTERLTIALTDGRNVEVLALGPPGGLPLAVHHGTPGRGLAPTTLPPSRPSATACGSSTWPGPATAGSSPRPGRRVANVAEDVAEVLDALGAETFVTHGTSGGGPHALACAYSAAPAGAWRPRSISGVAPPVTPRAWTGWPGWARRNRGVRRGGRKRARSDLTAFLEKERGGAGDLPAAYRSPPGRAAL